jgi:hypothetical protein
MKERLATFATIFALIGGTGGAVAFAGGGDHGNGKGAAHGQYCEGHEKEHGRGHAKHDDCGQGDDEHHGDQHGKGGDHHAKSARAKSKHHHHRK